MNELFPRFSRVAIHVQSIERKRVLVQVCCLAHLSVGRSFCPSVCPVGELWKNGSLDLDAVWGSEWGRSRDGFIRWGANRRKGKGQFWE